MIKEDIDLPTKQIPEWVVGNGKSINLWYDNWIDNDPISSKFNHFHFSENDLVSDLISDDEWLIPSQLPGSLQEFLSQATNLIPLGIPPAPDSLFWKNSSGKLSLQEAWNLLRTPDSIKTWSSLIWNNLLNPRLACHSWRLMHRRTPTEIWAKSKGWSMASRCHNCFIDEESDLHLFFSCSLAQKFWAWLLSPCEVRFLYPISASSIWHSIAKDADVLGRKCAASIFFHAIFILWQLRNDSKHNSRLPNLERAKVLFLDRLKSMVNSATGCCFVKFATSEEADRAIRALHNQVTLPGGLGPIQVRYADGERERLGNFPSAVEYKLFVGSMSRQATEREVEEIFSPYGRVEDVYIMRDDLKQSRGCGFVKFSHREMAEAAIRALNGTYLMRGCDQPLTVRFADPKRPRAGESRFGPAFGGPGFGPRSQETVGVRPPPNLGDSLGGRYPPHAWQPMSPKNAGPSSQVANTFGGHLSTRDGVGTLPSTAAGSLGVLGGTTNGSFQGLSVTQSLTSQQTSTPSAAQNQPFGQKLSPMQKPLQSPQHLPSSLQLNQQQPPTSLSQSQSSHTSNQQLGQLQLPHAIGQYSLGLAIPSQPLFGSSGQLSVSQPQVQQSASAAALQSSLNIQQQGLHAAVVQQHPSISSVHQQLLQPTQQPPSQLSHILMQQQVQALQSSFQSSQQAFSQLQQQLHSMHPTAQGPQLNSQTSKPQSPWSGVMPQTVVSSPANAPATVAPSTISATPGVPVSTQAVSPQTCNWTEHTSPEGYKYYYNSVTTESRWEKPDELTLFEQQQQQQKLQQQHLQKLSVPQLQPQSQTQLGTQIQSTQQASQMQQLQPQSQLRQQQQPQIQLRQPSLASPYQASGGIQSIQDQGYAQLQASNSSVIDCARFQQGLQAAQEWMWKNKPAGT